MSMGRFTADYYALHRYNDWSLISSKRTGRELVKGYRNDRHVTAKSCDANKYQKLLYKPGQRNASYCRIQSMLLLNDSRLPRYMMKSTYAQTTMRFKLGSQTNKVLIVWNMWTVLLALSKKVREKSRECHNHKPQPIPDTKRTRKQAKSNKRKSNKRTKSEKISSLFLKRGSRNTKRIEKKKTRTK